MLLCENLSRLALLAHMFNGKSFVFFWVERFILCDFCIFLCSGCEEGYKAPERLAKELLVKSLSSLPLNTGPLEVGKKNWKNICFFFKENKKLCDVTGSSRRGAGCWCKG